MTISYGSADQRHPLVRYLLAFVVAVSAVGVTWAIRPLVAPSVTPPFILAVAIAALYGGTGPGVLAALLSLLALAYWFFPPLRLDTPADLARLVMFLVVAAITAVIAGTVQRQRWNAVREAREKERLRQAAEEAAQLAKLAATRAEEATRQAMEASHLAEEEAVKAEEATAEAETAAQEAAEALDRQLKAERALRQSEAELADFFDNATTPLHWVGADGTILRVNQAELDLLGYKRSEYVGRHIAEFHVDRPAIDDILTRLLAGEVISSYPARLRCSNGDIKDVLIDSSGYHADGRFVHTRCFTRDITAVKQSQEAAARLVAIVSSSTDAIISKTLDGVITSWNAAAERIFGYTASEMIGQPVFKLIPEELHDSERFILEELRKGNAVEFSESERVRKDGTRIWISLSVSPVRDQAGGIIGAASIKRDVTERKAVAEHLRDTQRLQAVGQLAGGMAHEANNQMSVVLGGVHFLLGRTDLAPAAREDIEYIRQAAERTAGITQQLLAFSRQQIFQLQDVDLNRVVQSIEPVLRRSLSEAHELVVQPGLHDGLVRADPRQLEQVLLNLTLNARDAMPDGGRLTIETSEVTLPASKRGDPGRPPAGRYAALVVQDTGRGMDQETLQRVFEPFFTTKDVGLGTGLGLSVVHGIVSQSGGYINVQSEPGKGATFRLYFPITSSGRLAEPPAATQTTPEERGRVALLVEDDSLVRTMAARGLTEAGYVVLEASNGRAAIELVRSHPGRLDVVITDIGMPEMGGYQLGRLLDDEKPEVPILYMSGYGDADGVSPILRKPFAPDVLVRKVSEILQQFER
jgi:PAS domain S-box-containing protein